MRPVPTRAGCTVVMTPILSAIELSKAYPGVQSLAAAGLEIGRGEVHALAGENGAGKSTLVRLLAGAERPDSGQIVFDGAPVAWSSPREAQDAGIHVIYQEFALFPELSVTENVFLGAEPRRASVLMRRAEAERRARAPCC